MLATQHPCDDELRLYLLNRLPARKSVRVAEHLLVCPRCVELSAEIEDWIHCRHVTALDESLHTSETRALAHRNPITVSARTRSWPAAYSVAATIMLTVGAGMFAYQRGASSQPPQFVSAPPMTEFSGPPLKLGGDLIQPVVIERIVRTCEPPTRRSELRASRYFVAPPMQKPTAELEYVPPPAEPKVSIASMGSLQLAAPPTDIGNLPQWRADSGKKNLFLRFFNTIAKPFLPDKM